MPISQHRLVVIALAVAGVALVVAMVAVGQVVQLTSSAGGQTQSTGSSHLAPLELTPDNPASKLPHSDNVGFSGGPVVSITDTQVTVGVPNEMQTVALTAETEYYEQGPLKTKEEYDREFAEFQKILKFATGATEIFMAPERFKTIAIARSDIAVGDILNIRTDGEVPPTALTIYRLPSLR